MLQFDADARGRLPDGVSIEEDALVDAQMRGRYPITPATRMYLELLLTGARLGKIVEAVVARFDLPADSVRRDLGRLVEQLNHAWLLELQPGPDRPGLAAVLLHPVAALQRRTWWRSVRRRRGLDGSPVDAVGAIAAEVVSHHCLTWAALLLALVAIVAITVPWWLPYSLALGAGLVAGQVCHEIGHGLAAHLLGTPSFIGSSRAGGVVVVHAQTRDAPRIVVAGPALAAAVGLAAVAVGLIVGSAVPCVFGLPMVFQLLGLTTVAADGRNLLALWR
jgi:hypothetical protein